MTMAIEYSDEPMEMKVVLDFLPSHTELAKKNPNKESLPLGEIHPNSAPYEISGTD